MCVMVVACTVKVTNKDLVLEGIDYRMFETRRVKLHDMKQIQLYEIIRYNLVGVMPVVVRALVSNHREPLDELYE